jgi:CDP-diacylglycerol--glycerol-3-phosphate 3-phosphatidyltransferase
MQSPRASKTVVVACARGMTGAVHSMESTPGRIATDQARGPRSTVLPGALVGVVLGAVERVAALVVVLGISANLVTLASLGLSAVASIMLAFGHYAWAWPVLTLAFVGDAVDGAVARRTGSASVSGALLDASVDRYEEALLLGGLAVHLRESVPGFVLCLAALTGAFMVSYGSAKAEAIGARVPPGVMRRAERAVTLSAGVGAAAALAPFVADGTLPALATRIPLLVALGLVAVVGNASAVRRLVALARGHSRPSPASRRAGEAREPVPASSGHNVLGAR